MWEYLLRDNRYKYFFPPKPLEKRPTLVCVEVNESGEEGLWEGLGYFVLDFWFGFVKKNEQHHTLVYPQNYPGNNKGVFYLTTSRFMLLLPFSLCEMMV